VAEPPWKCSRAIAGNSAAGMPKIIALVSTASMPPTTLLCLTYLSPFAMDRNPGRVPSACLVGGSGLMNHNVSPNTARQKVSMP
jgi:hypothetical protein